MINRTFMLSVIVILLVAGPAEALQLNLLDFSSLGTLNVSTDIVINSDTRQLSGGASFTGVLDATTNATVFTFDSIQAANISILGSSPLAILSKGNISLNGPVTSSIASELELAAAGTVTVNNGVLSANGSTLTILANEVRINSQLTGAGAIVAGGNLTLATTQGLVPQGPVTGGNLTLVSQTGPNLFHSLNAFKVQPGEVQLFTGNISLQGSTIVPRGVTIVSDQGAIDGVTITAGPPVPLPGAMWLFGTGLVGLLRLWRRKV